VPDILCIAKGIASGLPLGAIVAPASIMRWPRGAHANTFGGNPLACAAALETIRLLRGGLVDNARRMGERLHARLEGIAGGFPRLARVRGRGLMIGADFVTERGSREPDPALADRVVEEAFRRGLLLLTAGPSTVRFCPPLVVRPSEIDVGASIFAEAVRAAVRKVRR
ncbi:MAG: aminotransferase class III-fold pyridoxal phosphate-dependent enzyme, partial [Planctomycetes bacterium]|nr:aminotransferase class III-fold pyridoxal phosphate-dependent enzyme [Planctomycetota bacterium]